MDGIMKLQQKIKDDAGRRPSKADAMPAPSKEQDDGAAA